MPVLKLPNQPVIFWGDPLKGLNDLDSFLIQHSITSTTFIQVGDMGIGMTEPEQQLDKLERYNVYLKNTNCHLYIIRGNHDNPQYFTDSPPIQIDCSNITLLQDYTLLQHPYLGNILCVGGGTSIDRQDRTINVDYWEDEQFHFDLPALQSLVEDNSIRVVASHIAPSSFPALPFLQSEESKGVDPYLTVDVGLEREALNDLKEEIMKYSGTQLIWFHGHYNESYYSYQEGIDIYSLADGEFKQLADRHLIGLSDIQIS